jgi:hypothetical protein
MNLLIIVLIILLLAGGGAWPAWGWHNMGYWPSGIIGVLLLIVVLKLLGVL